MENVINSNLFFVKEHVGIFKAANNYDILNPETNEILIECREENLGAFTKFFRFTKYKRMTPFNIILKLPNQKQITRIERGLTWFTSKVNVYDENNTNIAYFKQKLFSLGGSFKIFDMNDNHVLTLQGKWTSWEFKILSPQNEELAKITKKWAGLGKELFTTADNYMIEISEKIPENSVIRKLILSSALCIDMVLKE